MDTFPFLPAAIGILIGIAVTLIVLPGSSKKAQKPKEKEEAQPLSNAGTELNILAVKLRSQITSTRWFSEMLLYREYGKFNFAQLEMLHQINESCHKSCDLLNQLFDYINSKEGDAGAPAPQAPAGQPMPPLPPSFGSEGQKS